MNGEGRQPRHRMPLRHILAGPKRSFPTAGTSYDQQVQHLHAHACDLSRKNGGSLHDSDLLILLRHALV